MQNGQAIEGNFCKTNDLYRDLQKIFEWKDFTFSQQREKNHCRKTQNSQAGMFLYRINWKLLEKDKTHNFMRLWLLKVVSAAAIFPYE